MTTPPAYPQSLFAPLRPDKRTSSRIVLVPYHNISAVQEFTYKVVITIRMPATADLFIPHNLTFDEFVTAYCPNFKVFNESGMHKRVAINPDRLVHILRNEKNKTVIVVDSTERVMTQLTLTKAFMVDEEMTQAARVFDEVGMRQVLAHLQ
jgi:hypothetical protein